MQADGASNGDHFALTQDDFVWDEAHFALRQDRFDPTRDGFVLMLGDFVWHEVNFALIQDGFASNGDGFVLMQDGFVSGGAYFALIQEGFDPNVGCLVFTRGLFARCADRFCRHTIQAQRFQNRPSASVCHYPGSRWCLFEQICPDH